MADWSCLCVVTTDTTAFDFFIHLPKFAVVSDISFNDYFLPLAMRKMAFRNILYKCI